MKINCCKDCEKSGDCFLEKYQLVCKKIYEAQERIAKRFKDDGYLVEVNSVKPLNGGRRNDKE